MDPQLQSILIESLDLLRQGQSVEQVLRRYPQQQARLRPLLETAQRLEAFNVQPTLVAQSRSRQAFLAEAEALSSMPRAHSSPLAWLQRLLLPMTALVMLLLVGVGLLTASASALPGDSLYNTKRRIESWQLSLAADSGQRADLIEQFRRERIAEIQQLIANDRDADVEFSGLIQRIQQDSWLIAGLETQIGRATQISGPAQAGNLADVAGRVSAGQLMALTITITGGPQPSPRPTATETQVPAPTMTPTVTSTPEPVPDVDPLTEATAVPEQEPTDTPGPTATMTPEPTPTAIGSAAPIAPSTPEPVDNENEVDDEEIEDDGGGDDGNSNEEEGGQDDSGSDNDNSEDNDNGGGEDNEENNNDSSEDDNRNDGSEDDNSNDDESDNANDNSGNENEEENDNSGDDSSGSGNDEDREEDNSGSG